MARKKEFYLKEAKESLEQAMSMLKDIDLKDKQAIRNAARQAQEATAVLFQLMGAVDAEIETPPPPPAKPHRIGAKASSH